VVGALGEIAAGRAPEVLTTDAADGEMDPAPVNGGMER
jgi:hypothetical protein